jgi:sugar transferase (PEP-CTERM/EpsH1 system associated)
VLFLAHRIPYPPNKGDKIRSYHQLKALRERGHEVHLVAFADESGDLRHREELTKLCASVTIVSLDRSVAKVMALWGLVRSQSFSVAYFSSRLMEQRVSSLMTERCFDAVVACSSPMAQYVPARLMSHCLVDLIDADSEKWGDYAQQVGPPRSWLYQLERRRLRHCERAIIARCGHAIVTTEREAALLTRTDEPFENGRLEVITNGVDLEYFRPDLTSTWAMEHLPQAQRSYLADSSATRLVFTGRMDYAPNVDGVRFFVHKVFPAIRERDRQAQFLIVGANPTREVRRLGNHPGVVVTGYVEDVRPYLATASVCVVPLRIARGVQNKVLEAMASGCAVVATPTATAGLGAKSGRHLLVGQSGPDLSETLLRLMSDAPLRRRLGEQARSYVELHHRWPPLLDRYSELVESLTAPSRLLR